MSQYFDPVVDEIYSQVPILTPGQWAIREPKDPKIGTYTAFKHATRFYFIPAQGAMCSLLAAKQEGGADRWVNPWYYSVRVIEPDSYIIRQDYDSTTNTWGDMVCHRTADARSTFVGFEVDHIYRELTDDEKTEISMYLLLA